MKKKIDGDAHRLWYLGPMWRYERPQKGRFRQFYQAGIEILGHEEGLAELEMISLICSINTQLEIKNPVLVPSSERKIILKSKHLKPKPKSSGFVDIYNEYCSVIRIRLDVIHFQCFLFNVPFIIKFII